MKNKMTCPVLLAAMFTCCTVMAQDCGDGYVLEQFRLGGDYFGEPADSWGDYIVFNSYSGGTGGFVAAAKLTGDQWDDNYISIDLPQGFDFVLGRALIAAGLVAIQGYSSALDERSVFLTQLEEDDEGQLIGYKSSELFTVSPPNLYGDILAMSDRYLVMEDIFRTDDDDIIIFDISDPDAPLALSVEYIPPGASRSSPQPNMPVEVIGDYLYIGHAVPNQGPTFVAYDILSGDLVRMYPQGTGAFRVWGVDQDYVYLSDYPSSAIHFYRTETAQLEFTLPGDENWTQIHQVVRSGDVVITRGRNDPPDDGESLYVYNISDINNMHKYTELEGHPGDDDRFAALDNMEFVAGRLVISTYAYFQPRWYSFFVDADGDGLPDDWELSGVPYIGEDGMEHRYELQGANWQRKDIFVEVDAMGLSNQLVDDAVADLEQAFASAPVCNPDKTSGIELHVVRDEISYPSVSVWDLLKPGDDMPADFWKNKDAKFGTVVERSGPDGASRCGAKRKAFRYCVMANACSLPSSGVAQFGGDNMIIFIDGLDDDSPERFAEDQAATFMHELGHCLGLRHGGGDDINYKPNYPSIMNYTLTRRYEFSRVFWRLDYSRSGADSLNALAEGNLLETVGVGSAGNYYAYFDMPFGVDVSNPTTGGVVRDVRLVSLNGSPVDWASTSGGYMQDGQIIPLPVSQDLNYFVTDGTLPGNLDYEGFPKYPSPSQLMVPHDDWSSLEYRLSQASNSIDFGGEVFVDPDAAFFSALGALIPEPCHVDMNSDGVLDSTDVSEFMLLHTNQHYVADWNGDGSWNFFDIRDYSIEFTAGCP